eukprot:m.215082 g.215082  ORF g.215082 m.215082 type:complete len:717 (+) comp25608_c0_seq2:217-2367(+)
MDQGADQQALQLQELLRMSQQLQQQQPAQAVQPPQAAAPHGGPPPGPAYGMHIATPTPAASHESAMSESEKQHLELAKLLRMTQMSQQPAVGHAAVVAPSAPAAAPPTAPRIKMESALHSKDNLAAATAAHHDGGKMTQSTAVATPTVPSNTQFTRTEPRSAGAASQPLQHPPRSAGSQTGKERMDIRRKIQERIDVEFAGNTAGALAYLEKTYHTCIKMGKQWLAQMIAEMHQARMKQHHQEQNAIQGRKQKGVHNGSEAPVATAARASVVPSVPFAKSAAPAPNNQLCGWARCTLSRSDGGQHCTGHTCKTPGCTSGKTPSSPFCRSCEVAIRQQSRQTPTSGSSASARPVAVAVPEWAEKHRKEWDMLEGQRGRVTDMMVRLYESITKNNVASAEALLDLDKANTRQLITDFDNGSKQPEQALTVLSYRRVPPPDAIMTQVPIDTLLVAREGMVAKRLVERRRQLTEQHTARTAAEAARVQPAMETEGEAGADDADVHVEIERKALGLLRMQRALRSNIISCEQGRNGRLATKTLRNDNTRVAHQVSKLKVKLEEKEKNLRRREETRWLTHLMDHRKLFFDFHREVSASRQRTANSVIALLEKQARDSQRSENREEKERLAALRMNDEDGYRALIDTKKHGRLAHLLDTTDEYMSKMMSQISDHQQVELAQEKEGQEKPAPIVANGSSDSAPAVRCGSSRHRWLLSQRVTSNA